MTSSTSDTELKDGITSIIYGADWKNQDIANAFKPDVEAAMELIHKAEIKARLEEMSSGSMSYSKELRRMKHHLDIGNLTEKGLGSYEEMSNFEEYRLRRIAELQSQLSEKSKE